MATMCNDVQGNGLDFSRIFQRFQIGENWLERTYGVNIAGAQQG
jgi:hypothetical protein